MSARRGHSVLVTLRVSEEDRALLDALVEVERRELEPRSVDVSLSSVMRRLIRQEAHARGVDPSPAPPVATTATARAPRQPKAPAQATVRALLRSRLAETRGLGAVIARRFGVEPSQVSRFKAGKEPFPTGKLAELLTFLKEGHDE
jgi:hypothetical protein